VPRISKAPTDTDQNVVSNGSATYFSAKQLQLVGPTAVQNIEVFKGDPPTSTATVAVIHYTSHLVNRQTKASISYDKETYAMDRNTGLAMNCCGESPKMSGETVKFPFGTKKITYQLWDPSANASFPVHYARTEDLEGVTSYVLLGTSPKVQIGTIGLPNSLLGVQGQGLTTVPEWYQADTTVWVEPATGRVMKGAKHVHQWAGDQSGAPLLELADLRRPVLRCDGELLRRPGEEGRQAAQPGQAWHPAGRRHRRPDPDVPRLVPAPRAQASTEAGFGRPCSRVAISVADPFPPSTGT